MFVLCLTFFPKLGACYVTLLEMLEWFLCPNCKHLYACLFRSVRFVCFFLGWGGGDFVKGFLRKASYVFALAVGKGTAPLRSL